MTKRENFLRTVNFGYPEWIPMYVAVNQASLIQFSQDMESVMSAYPEWSIWRKANRNCLSLSKS